MTTTLRRDRLIEALRALDAECGRRELAGEICIYGGAGMILVFDAREATRDVDAVLRPRTEILDAARAVAADLGLPEDWLNDGVKGFLSRHEDLLPIPALEGLAHLRVLTPTPQYLLAMKCLAARSGETSEDRADAELLVRALGLRTEAEVFDILGRFYPLDRLHVRSRYFVSEVLADMPHRDGP